MTTTTDPSSRRPQHRVAPALVGATGWLNSTPLTPEGLRGHVVMYVFWTYTCINWLRALPYVRAWEAKYRGRGLVVVGIHTPEFAFEQDLDNVAAAVRSHDIQFPVALDSDYEVWRSFDNHYWPALYLTDGGGVIRYTHFGEGRYAETERAIQHLLSEAGGVDVDHDLVAATGTGDEAPADWDDLESVESYLGYGRAEGFASDGGLRRDLPREYSVPPRLLRDTWAVSGWWTIREDRIVADQPGASIVFRFHARDLHLVMTPKSSPVAARFLVSLDGQAPGEAHGRDVDASGAGVLTESRMYQLIRQGRPVVDRTAEITFPDAGAAAFVVTFG